MQRGVQHLHAELASTAPLAAPPKPHRWTWGWQPRRRARSAARTCAAGGRWDPGRQHMSSSCACALRAQAPSPGWAHLQHASMRNLLLAPHHKQNVHGPQVCRCSAARAGSIGGGGFQQRMLRRRSGACWAGLQVQQPSQRTQALDHPHHVALPGLAGAQHAAALCGGQGRVAVGTAGAAAAAMLQQGRQAGMAASPPRLTQVDVFHRLRQ